MGQKLEAPCFAQAGGSLPLSEWRQEEWKGKGQMGSGGRGGGGGGGGELEEKREEKLQLVCKIKF